MKPGDSVDIGARTATLDGFVPRAGPNYLENAVRFTVRSGGNVVAVMEPSKRRFNARATETTEAAGDPPIGLLERVEDQRAKGGAVSNDAELAVLIAVI